MPNRRVASLASGRARRLRHRNELDRLHQSKPERSGHRHTRANRQRAAGNGRERDLDISYVDQVFDHRDIAVWLAPIAGTRLMVPYRVTIPTPFGLGLMQAIQFV